MKKIFTIAALVFAAFSLSGCGFGSGSNAASTGSGILGSVLGGAATNNNGSVLSSVLGGSGNGSGVLGTVLTNLLGNTTTAKSIVGTWTYSSPKVVFESENVLAQIGSSVASSSIEKQLNSQLSKMGFKQGVSSMTFNSDGTCTLSLSNKTMNGTYTYNSSTNVMTVKGAFGVASISPTVSVVGNEMYMVFEADKLLNVFSSVVGNVASNLSGILSKYNGLKLGWTMVR